MIAAISIADEHAGIGSGARPDEPLRSATGAAITGEPALATAYGAIVLGAGVQKL